MTEGDRRYELRVTGPAERQLSRLDHRVATAIVEFLLGPLRSDPHRVGGQLRRELAGMRAARRGAYRVLYEIDEDAALVIVHRIDHSSTVYRPG